MYSNLSILDLRCCINVQVFVLCTFCHCDRILKFRISGRQADVVVGDNLLISYLQIMITSEAFWIQGFQQIYTSPSAPFSRFYKCDFEICSLLLLSNNLQRAYLTNYHYLMASKWKLPAKEQCILVDILVVLYFVRHQKPSHEGYKTRVVSKNWYFALKAVCRSAWFSSSEILALVKVYIELKGYL
jgi:hypothetical protein